MISNRNSQTTVIETTTTMCLFMDPEHTFLCVASEGRAQGLGAEGIWGLTHSEMWLILILTSGLMVTPACGLYYPYGFLPSSLHRAELQLNILEDQWELPNVLMTLPQKSLNITSSYWWR